MKAFLLAAFALLLCAPARAALSSQAEAYMKSIGLNPQSKEVMLADADGVIETTYENDPAEYSLDQLALGKKKNGLMAFIGTRVFIARLKKDFATTNIPTVNYDPLYLTVDERALVGRKFAERFKKKG